MGISAFISRTGLPGMKARETASSYCKIWKNRVINIASSSLSKGLDHPIRKPRHQCCCVAFETPLPGEELLQYQETQPGWEMTWCHTAQPWGGTNHQQSACSRQTRPHTDHAASPRGAAESPAVPDTSRPHLPEQHGRERRVCREPGGLQDGVLVQGGLEKHPSL